MTKMKYKITEPKNKEFCTVVELVGVDVGFMNNTYMDIGLGYIVKKKLNREYVVQSPIFYKFRIKLAKKRLLKKLENLIKDRVTTDRIYFEDTI